MITKKITLQELYIGLHALDLTPLPKNKKTRYKKIREPQNLKKPRDKTYAAYLTIIDATKLEELAFPPSETEIEPPEPENQPKQEEQNPPIEQELSGYDGYGNYNFEEEEEEETTESKPKKLPKLTKQELEEEAQHLLDLSDDPTEIPITAIYLIEEEVRKLLLDKIDKLSANTES